jgi:hypothetical protein
VKYLCWWDKEKKCVLKHVLDIDAADSKSLDAAESNDTSLCKIDQPGWPKTKLAGHSSDAGGRGTRNSLYLCLKGKYQAEQNYLIATCSIHAWQRVLGNAIKGCSGPGGMYMRVLLQMIHTVFQLQGKFEVKEFKAIWESHTDKEYEKLDKPNIGCWESVGDAGCNLWENWDAWHKMTMSVGLE